MRITSATVATGGLAAALWLGLPHPAAGQTTRSEGAPGPARARDTRLFAQAQPQPGNPQSALAPLGPEFDQSADRTRDQLEELFQRYPPGLRSVLRLDPSLLNNRDYLSPYPALGAFLAQHPEVAHNPSYFVGTPSQIGGGGSRAGEDPSIGRLRVVGDIVMGFFVFLGVTAMIGVVGWTIKMIVDHRRWLRSWKVQNEAHAKLIDRLASNDELLAYLQSPVAKRLLEAAPPAAQQPGAPLGRILFSVQVGTVAALVGLGFLLMSRYIYSYGELSEMAPVLVMFGSLLLAGGIGFIISAGASYYLSKQLGLLSPVNSSHA